MTTATIDLDTPLTVSAEQITSFRDQGFIHLRDILPPELLTQWRKVITGVAHGANSERRPLAERDTYGKAFLQTTNLWELDPAVHPFVFSKRLAGIARQLLGTAGIRLYHDQALFKEGGGGHTPWHADQYYWPLGSAQTVTAWIPLVAVPMAMGPLAFSAGSHRLSKRLDVAISDESEASLNDFLEAEGLPYVEEPFDLGDVSFHYGWTYHRAGPNRSDSERSVMTMIYMDSEMRLKEPENRAQESDRKRWCPDVAVGEICASRLNPVLA